MDISQVQASSRARHLDRPADGSRPGRTPDHPPLRFRDEWPTRESIAPSGANGVLSPEPGAALADWFAPG